jgi:hypothetical protein
MPPKPNTRNRFANKLSPEQERSRRLYLLDSQPLHSLQIFGVPQYLPSNIYGYNSISTADLQRHHDRVRELIEMGHLDLTKFDADGLENSLAFVFGFEVPSRTLAEPSKKYRVLQIYYAAPPSDDVPVGVFGNEEAREESAWSELPRPLKKSTPLGNPKYFHTSFKSAEDLADALQGRTAASRDRARSGESWDRGGAGAREAGSRAGDGGDGGSGAEESEP